MRYEVIPPVEGPNGHAYYNVIDKESPIMINFALATFHKSLIEAPFEAQELCDRLNKGQCK